MVVVRGVNVYPAAIEDLLRRHDGVDEFRATISRRQEMAEMRIEVECSEGTDTERTVLAVRSAIEDALGMRPEVVLVPRGTLDRFELKARRFFIT